MSAGHSKYSASGFAAAAACPGKPVMEKNRPDSTSKHAAEGTAAHAMLEWCLKSGKDAATFVGHVQFVDGFEIRVSDDMAAAVQTALGHMRDIAGDGMLLSEQRVNYANALGVEDAEGWGTADAIALRGDELIVMDYKHGRGVPVAAGHNIQMQLYALGALRLVDGIDTEVKSVRLVILQPRIADAPSEWRTTPEALREWAASEARPAVALRESAENLHNSIPMREWSVRFLGPNEKSCKFCRAKAVCPALRNTVTDVVFSAGAATPDEFDALPAAPATIKAAVAVADEDWLAASLRRADLVEGWVAAVRAAVHARLAGGLPVPGYKLVAGKRGARTWNDVQAVEGMVELGLLPDTTMYTKSLITPTQTEKRVKSGELTQDQWSALTAHITQSAGTPSVVPEDDPRSAIASIESEFQPN